jgi:hypothetical protein
MSPLIGGGARLLTHLDWSGGWKPGRWSKAMVKVKSNQDFNIDEESIPNWAVYLRAGTGHTFSNNINQRIDGRIYADKYVFKASFEGQNFQFALYGQDLKVDTRGFPKSGTVTAMVCTQTGVEGAESYTVTNMSASIKSMYDSMKTLNDADEITILKAILAGNDTFSLLGRGSGFVHGYGGNDKIVAQGDLYGDDGNDTLISRGVSNLTGGRGVDKFHVNRSDDILDFSHEDFIVLKASRYGVTKAVLESQLESYRVSLEAAVPRNANDHFVFEKATHYLYYFPVGDQDGDSNPNTITGDSLFHIVNSVVPNIDDFIII